MKWLNASWNSCSTWLFLFLFFCFKIKHEWAIAWHVVEADCGVCRRNLTSGCSVHRNQPTAHLIQSCVGRFSVGKISQSCVVNTFWKEVSVKRFQYRALINHNCKKENKSYFCKSVILEVKLLHVYHISFVVLLSCYRFFFSKTLILKKKASK